MTDYDFEHFDVPAGDDASHDSLAAAIDDHIGELQEANTREVHRRRLAEWRLRQIVCASCGSTLDECWCDEAEMREAWGDAMVDEIKAADTQVHVYRNANLGEPMAEPWGVWELSIGPDKCITATLVEDWKKPKDSAE